MPGSAILAIKIIADASQAVKELGTTGKATSDFEKGIKGLTAPAAGIAGALGAMTIAAAEDKRQTDALNKVYQNATGTTDDYTGAIESASKAGEAKAFTDNEVRAALQPLIIATGDAEEANKLLGPALDIARLAGVSAETAAVALAKAHEGSAAALAGLLPGLDQGASASDAIANATLLAAGAAEEYAASGPGQIAAVMNAFTEFGEMIGSTFLPAIEPLAGFLKDVTGYLTAQKDIVGPLAVLFGAMAVAILAVSVAMGALAVVTAPINLLIIGLVAIGAGLIMLYQRSELFRDIVNAVFDFVLEVIETCGEAIKILGQVAQRVFDGVGLVVKSVFDVIKGIFDGVLAWMQDPFISFQEIADAVFQALGRIVSTAIDAIAFIFNSILAFLRQPFEDFQTIATGVFDIVKGAVQTTFDIIKGIWDGMLAILSGPFEAFDDVVKAIMDTVTGLVRDAVGIIEGILDGIRGAIQTVSDAVDAINPFSVMPPPAGASTLPSARARGASATTTAAGGTGGNLTVHVYGGDPWRVERAIARGYRGWTRSSGPMSPIREY